MSWMSGHGAASLRLGREAGARWRLPWGGWGALGLGVLAGTLLQLQQARLVAPAWYGAALAGALLGALCVGLFEPGGAARRRWRGQQAAVVALLLVGLLAGAVAWGAAGLRAVQRLQQALAPELEGQDLLLEGQVASLPQSGAWGWRFVFQVESARLQGRPVAVPRQLLLGWNPMQHPARPVGDDDAQAERELVEGVPGAVAGGGPALGAPQAPVPGQRWRVTARLKRVHGARNPGGFDHELWLWEQGILASAWVRARSVSEAPRLLASSWAYPIERLRHRVREAMVLTLGSGEVATPGTGAGVVVALVTGDQRSISRWSLTIKPYAGFPLKPKATW
ncbi:MAG: ComEC family competence protein [Curvibacter sp.]|nr:MAG: ComEC family competence protein [Curvibacter sp.]